MTVSHRAGPLSTRNALSNHRFQRANAGLLFVVRPARAVEEDAVTAVICRRRSFRSSAGGHVAKTYSMAAASRGLQRVAARASGSAHAQSLARLHRPTDRRPTCGPVVAPRFRAWAGHELPRRLLTSRPDPDGPAPSAAEEDRVCQRKGWH